LKEDLAFKTGGGSGDEELLILEEENERVREFDGVFAPDRQSEGNIEMCENVEGAVTISLVLWLVKEGFNEDSTCHKISGG
jgi:hypothetical protein